MLTEYDRVHAAYSTFAAQLKDLLERLLKSDEIPVHAVEARVKDRMSLERKLLRQDRHYSSLTEVTDLVGARVITYLADGVEHVKSLVEREFAVDVANSADKRFELAYDRVGYLSSHYVVQLRPERHALLEYRNYSGLKAEIQIRSILQHAWAEIEHDLVYKASAEVALDIQRRIFRLAGLFELADQEFVEVRDALRSRLPSTPLHLIPVTSDALENFVEQDPAVIEVDRYIARYLSAVIVGSDTEPELSAKWRLLGVQTVGALRKQLIEHMAIIRRFVRLWRAGERAPATYRGVSLFYLRYVILAERRDRELARLVLADVGVRADRDALIDRLFSIDLSAGSG